ncbi:transcription regulator [Pseudohyphozyma bogoriensis]|nr:transcription regulator [Pseudohyphozyma bogoriensis]
MISAHPSHMQAALAHQQQRPAPALVGGPPRGAPAPPPFSHPPPGPPGHEYHPSPSPGPYAMLPHASAAASPGPPYFEQRHPSLGPQQPQQQLVGGPQPPHNPYLLASSPHPGQQPSHLQHQLAPSGPPSSQGLAAGPSFVGTQPPPPHPQLQRTYGPPQPPLQYPPGSAPAPQPVGMPIGQPALAARNAPPAAPPGDGAQIHNMIQQHLQQSQHLQPKMEYPGGPRVVVGPPAHAAPAASDNDRRNLFHSYILEYLQKQGFSATAAALVREAPESRLELLPTASPRRRPTSSSQNGQLSKSDDEASPPDSVTSSISHFGFPALGSAAGTSSENSSPESGYRPLPGLGGASSGDGFLYEWWEVFWDVFTAKSGAGGLGSGGARAYVDAVREGLERRQYQNSPQARQFRGPPPPGQPMQQSDGMFASPVQGQRQASQPGAPPPPPGQGQVRPPANHMGAPPPNAGQPPMPMTAAQLQQQHQARPQVMGYPGPPPSGQQPQQGGPPLPQGVTRQQMMNRRGALSPAPLPLPPPPPGPHDAQRQWEQQQRANHLQAQQQRNSEQARYHAALIASQQQAQAQALAARSTTPGMQPGQYPMGMPMGMGLPQDAGSPNKRPDYQQQQFGEVVGAQAFTPSQNGFPGSSPHPSQFDGQSPYAHGPPPPQQAHTPSYNPGEYQPYVPSRPTSALHHQPPSMGEQKPSFPAEEGSMLPPPRRMGASPSAMTPTANNESPQAAGNPPTPAAAGKRKREASKEPKEAKKRAAKGRDRSESVTSTAQAPTPNANNLVVGTPFELTQSPAAMGDYSTPRSNDVSSVPPVSQAEQGQLLDLTASGMPMISELDETQKLTNDEFDGLFPSSTFQSSGGLPEPEFDFSQYLSDDPFASFD